MKKISQVHQPISITKIQSISALGTTPETVWESYNQAKPLFKKRAFKSGNNQTASLWCAPLSSEVETALISLQKKSAYRNLDRTALMAILAAQGICTNASEEKNIGVNIGSSRGATQLFEQYHRDFLAGEGVSAYSSPTTTLGNISSWVSQDLQLSGPQIDHSVTCSTAMHAVLNGIAWLQADMADRFIVGGSEAALTSFTVAQMQALGLYATSENHLACESMRFQKKKNSLVLGEAAAMAYLERGISERTLAVISGYGFASEVLTHGGSISEDALCFQQSMQMALAKAEIETVDAIILHAPGTVKGDMAEKNAIDAVFGKQLPLLTSNKWIVGHTFAASGMLSLELAILMMQHNKFIENPFFANARHLPKEIKTVLINAVGFGGNAVSIIISKP